jgi:uncharacterized delta-60 repeat protein
VDQTFGINGYVQINFGATYDEPEDVVIQSDGKIIIVGSATLASGVNFCVARLNTDGTLDNTFNTIGQYNLYINGACYAYKANVQPDGKILVGGSSTVNSERVATMFRLNTDGTLDLTFGASGIVEMDAVPADNRSEILDIERNGTDIYALGYSNLNFTNNKTVVYKLSSNGTLDATFDTDGMKVINQMCYRKIIVQPNGSFVTFGNGLVVKYLPSGASDNSFADGGYLGISNVSIFDAIRGADSNYYYTGTNAGMNDKMIVGRLLPDFKKDTTFCDSSKTSFSIGMNHSAYNIMQQSDGKLLVGGNADSAVVVRFMLSSPSESSFYNQVSSDFSIYPTVVVDNRIHFSQTIQTGELSIYASTGQLVHKSTLKAAKDYAINADLQGIYFIQVKTMSWSKTFKVILRD